MKTKNKWEDVTENTFRLKVFGGWMVMYQDRVDSNNEWRSTMVFLSDPTHLWEIEVEEATETPETIEIPFVYYCSKCGMSFSTKQERIDHENDKHFDFDDDLPF